LQCAYHGWRFDPQGACREVPGLASAPEAQATKATSFAAREQDGFIWVYSAPGVEPTEAPFRFPHLGEAGYTSARREYAVDGTLYAVLENTLDVPHTAFLHGGLFRSEEAKNTITAIVRRGRDRVEAQFVGEPRPPGIAARILSPSGGEVQHWDRFFLPSIAQVEYRLGGENHIMTTSMCTPVTETRTVMHAILSVRTRMPVRFLAFFLMPFAYRIVKQDKVVLRAQTEIVDRFGTETFTSTPIDLLGPYILHLLKKAESGDLDGAIVREETTKIMV
jgi:phenylpropionate dioxygenase-like ring-hydroxylating dioxygenase large terminal subunit